LSRPEGSFKSAEEALLAPEELSALLAGCTDADAWQEAVACYFAAAEGWREAEPRLAGAFASDAALRLSGGKPE
jgi:hypothetical protein